MFISLFRPEQAKAFCHIGTYLLLICGLAMLQPAGADVPNQTVVVESASHNMGTGAEGSLFGKSFSMPSNFSNATLEFDIYGPNYESCPYAAINGNYSGSIQPFFPGGNQTNYDGSHDYNGWFHVSIPVTNFLVAGNNVFTPALRSQ